MGGLTIPKSIISATRWIDRDYGHCPSQRNVYYGKLARVCGIVLRKQTVGRLMQINRSIHIYLLGRGHVGMTPPWALS